VRGSLNLKNAFLQPGTFIGRISQNFLRCGATKSEKRFPQALPLNLKNDYSKCAPLRGAASKSEKQKSELRPLNLKNDFSKFSLRRGAATKTEKLNLNPDH